MVDRTPPQTFVGRWSRLKAGEAVAPPEAVPPAAVPDVPVADAIEAPLLTDADMPDVDALDEASDFSGFLSKGVSDGLRRRALDKLFRLPMCGVRDGLNDYDDDYTQLEELGDTVTYQMRQWAEQKAREELARQPAPDELRTTQENEDAATVAGLEAGEASMDEEA
ncbi:MAG: DUF3306 domain-containing protein [Zoogloeaceae bacterium]|nr:DUF3306 domain-containing protein [Rhodocyclaceae bacterium]MCP5236672.1 DUF3306 domain-containing protein [Zoogloeaceae bacterium]